MVFKFSTIERNSLRFFFPMANPALTFTSSRFLGSFLCFSGILFLSALAMADASGDPAVHIVYTERPHNDDPQAFHIRTLVSVLGSEQAAREALIYSYKTAASGFSAKLTPDQVSQILKQPGVLHVVPSGRLQLHSGPGRLH